jgi:hypothetical protein
MTIDELRQSLEDTSLEWANSEIDFFVRTKEFMNEIEITMKEFIDSEMKKEGFFCDFDIDMFITDKIIDKLKDKKLDKIIKNYFDKNHLSYEFLEIFKETFKYSLQDCGLLYSIIDFDKIIKEKFSKEYKISRMACKKILMESDFENEN